MKIRVTLKDPDTMQDAVEEQVKRQHKPDGITAGEWDIIRDERSARYKDAISTKWMEYGEYLVVEFEIDEDGDAIAATVLSNKHQ
jgi:DNA-binding LacI/PurR family transcriptional regulator